MKICFTGPLQDHSGFASASRLFLRTLVFADQAKDIQFSARSLRYDQADLNCEYKTEPWLKEILENDLQNVDVLIQCTTCNIEAVPKPGILNILYTFFELDRIPPHWIAKANEFDFIIVPCRFNGQMLLNCGIQKPVLIMPPPCNSDTYDDFLNPIQPYNIPNASNRTIFYNICQLSPKKGIDLLLRAYFAAFADMPDDVLLILKTYVNMVDRRNDLEMVKNFINQVKQGCQIPVQKLPPVLPIVNILSENDIYALHKRGDCYINSSRGEGWNIPLFDAMSFGRSVITNIYGAHEDYVNNDNALIYGGTVSHVYSAPHPEPYLYTGVSRWFEPSTTMMSDLMRNFHLLKRGSDNNSLNEENKKVWEKILNMRVAGQELANRFDYRRVGETVISHIIAGYKSWIESGKVNFGNINNKIVEK